MVWPSKILGRRKFFLVMGQDRRGHFEVFLSAAIVEMTSNLQPWMKSFLLDIVMITDCKSHDIEELHQAFLDGPILVSSKFRWSQFVRSATPHGQSRWVADSRFEHEPCVIDKTPRNKNYHPGHLTGFLGPWQSHRVVVLCAFLCFFLLIWKNCELRSRVDIPHISSPLPRQESQDVWAGAVASDPVSRAVLVTPKFGPWSRTMQLAPWDCHGRKNKETWEVEVRFV